MKDCATEAINGIHPINKQRPFTKLHETLVADEKPWTVVENKKRGKPKELHQNEPALINTTTPTSLMLIASSIGQQLRPQALARSSSGRTMKHRALKISAAKQVLAESVDGYEHIVIIVGSNDLQEVKSPWEMQQVKDSYVDMLNVAKQKHPHSRIHTVELLPRKDIHPDWIRGFNQFIAQQRGIQVISVSREFENKSYLFSHDAIHPNTRGAAVMASAIIASVHPNNRAYNNNKVLRMTNSSGATSRFGSPQSVGAVAQSSSGGAYTTSNSEQLHPSNRSSLKHPMTNSLGATYRFGSPQSVGAVAQSSYGKEYTTNNSEQLHPSNRNSSQNGVPAFVPDNNASHVGNHSTWAGQLSVQPEHRYDHPVTNSFGAKVGSQSVGAIPQLSSGAEYNGAVNNSDQFQLSNQNQFHKSTPAYVSDSNESSTPAYVYENSASHGYNRSAWVRQRALQPEPTYHDKYTTNTGVNQPWQGNIEYDTNTYMSSPNTHMQYLAQSTQWPNYVSVV